MPPRPVIMIHGVGSSFAHNFGASGFDAILAEDGRVVHAVELPGHGVRRTDEQAEAAAVIIEAARRLGGVDAVGFSAGGYALLVAAGRAPELFGAVVVIGVGDSGLQEHRGDGAGRSELAATLEADVEPAYGFGRMLRQIVESAGNDPAAVARFLRSEQPAPSRTSLGAVSARCLLVEGSDDAVGSAAQIEQAIPDARRVVINGADHFALPSDIRCMSAAAEFLQES